MLVVTLSLTGAIFFHNTTIDEEVLKTVFTERMLHQHQFRKLRQRVVGLEAQSTEATNGLLSLGLWLLWRALGLLFPKGALHWVLLSDEEFDISKHLRTIKLFEDNEDLKCTEHSSSHTGGCCSKCNHPDLRRRLEEKLSEIADSPLDYTIPLWQAYLLHYAPNCKALALRSHHAIGTYTFLGYLTIQIMNQPMDFPSSIF